MTNELVRLYLQDQLEEQVLRGWARSVAKIHGSESMEALLGKRVEPLISGEGLGDLQGSKIWILPRDPIVSAGTQGVFDILVHSAAHYENVDLKVDLKGIEGHPLDATDIVVSAPGATGTRVTLGSQGLGFSVHFDSIERVPDPWRFSITVIVEVPAEERVVTCKARIQTRENVSEDSAVLVATVQTRLEVEIDAGYLDELGRFERASEFDQSLGDSIIFELRVTNQTAFRASGIVVRNQCAPGTGLFSFRRIVFVSQGNVRDKSGMSFAWDVGELPPNTGATLRFVAEWSGTGIAENRAVVTSDQMSGEITNSHAVVLMNQ